MLVVFPEKRDIQYMHRSSGTKKRSKKTINEFKVARIGFWTHILV
jgi:hypothetical protein